MRSVMIVQMARNPKMRQQMMQYMLNSVASDSTMM